MHGEGDIIVSKYLFKISFLASEKRSGRKVWGREGGSVRFWPNRLARVGKLGLLKKRRLPES